VRRAAVFVLAALSAILISSELSLSLPIQGVGPDVLILVVVAFASGTRPTVSAGWGFAAGLARDLMLPSPRGVSALAYALTAYAVARLGEPRGVWAYTGLVGLASLMSQAIYGFGLLVLTPSASGSQLARVALAATVYNVLITPLLMPLLRRFSAPEGASLPTGVE
jgi:rod shape-determining protein MreD